MITLQSNGIQMVARAQIGPRTLMSIWEPLEPREAHQKARMKQDLELFMQSDLPKNSSGWRRWEQTRSARWDSAQESCDTTSETRKA